MTDRFSRSQRRPSPLGQDPARSRVKPNQGGPRCAGSAPIECASGRTKCAPKPPFDCERDMRFTAEADHWGGPGGFRVEFIPAWNLEVIVAVPPYETASGPKGDAQGWGDWPLFLVKNRFLSERRHPIRLRRLGGRNHVNPGDDGWGRIEIQRSVRRRRQGWKRQRRFRALGVCAERRQRDRGSSHRPQPLNLQWIAAILPAAFHVPRLLQMSASVTLYLLRYIDPVGWHCQ